MKPSLFTQIINREIPAEIVYEDDKTIAILDIYPASPGHTLVIPKRETKNILELTPQELEHTLSIAQKIGKALLSLDTVNGINILTNVNKAAGQQILHTHIHVVPRTGDEKFLTGEVNQYKNDEEKSEFADKLRDLLLSPVKYQDLHPDNPIPKE